MEKLTLQERNVIKKSLAARYRAARKRDKKAVLDAFCDDTGYNRSYATLLLRNCGRKVYATPRGVMTVYEGDPRPRQRRPRPPYYIAETRRHLVTLWHFFHHLCGKLLAPAIQGALAGLIRFGEITPSERSRQQLLRISPSTIDRLLVKDRKNLWERSKAKTKPGSLLRRHIPIRTFEDWDEKRPGFVEADTVFHDGGHNHGDFLVSLVVTDIATTWTLFRGLRNRAHRWVKDEFGVIRQRLPFPVLGFDSDNGSEFINHALVDYFREHNVTFTRSRPYRKNDNCYIEQKNGNIVRNYIGYQRFDTDRELQLLNRVYDDLGVFINFFVPTRKLISKERQGSKIRKHYDAPQTPLQRVLAHEAIPELTKRRLRLLYRKTNPAELQRLFSTALRQLARVPRTRVTLSGQR